MFCQNRWLRHTRLCRRTAIAPTRRRRRSPSRSNIFEARGKLRFNTPVSQVGGPMKFRNAVLSAAGVLVFSAACFAQTTSIEGDVIGADGKPMANIKCVVIDRKDIKGHYGPVKTDKKGHYFHAGLPIGQYKVSVIDENGKVLDSVDNVRSRLGDPLPVNFNLAAIAAKQAARQKAMESGKPI